MTRRFNRGAAFWNESGDTALRKKDFDLAIQYFEQAIKLDPGYVMAYYNMGLTYKDKGEYAKAIQCFEKAIDLNDDNSFIYYIDLGKVYKEKGDYAKAIQSFDKAIELDPHDDNFAKELIDEEIADMTGK